MSINYDLFSIIIFVFLYVEGISSKFALDYLNIPLFFDSLNFLLIFLIAKLTTIIKY